jgi:hypothetical protein
LDKWSQGLLHQPQEHLLAVWRESKCGHIESAMARI